MKLARKIDESASDVVGYGVATRCHEHCGVPQIITSTEQWTFQLCVVDGDLYSPERFVCS